MIKVIFRMVGTVALITLISCGAEDSSGSSSTDFKIQPGDVQIFSTTIEGKGTSFDVDFDDFNHQISTNGYAIIFQKNINSIDYVGIALGEEPKTNRKFKVFISWQSSSIANYNGSASVTVISDGIKYTNESATINFSITGPASNIYSITSNDSITVSHEVNDKTITFSGTDTIKAYLIQ